MYADQIIECWHSCCVCRMKYTNIHDVNERVSDCCYKISNMEIFVTKRKFYDFSMIWNAFKMFYFCFHGNHSHNLRLKVYLVVSLVISYMKMIISVNRRGNLIMIDVHFCRNGDQRSKFQKLNKHIGDIY